MNKQRGNIANGINFNVVEIDPSVRDMSSKRKTHSRMYILIEGENLLENLNNQHFRPVKLYQQFFFRIFQILQEQYNVVIDQKLTRPYWSQYAGCTCPCSPGFIIPDHQRREICVTLKVKSPVEKELLTSI